MSATGAVLGGTDGLAVQLHEDLEMVDRALSRLNWDQRTVFVLFELEGLSGEEIAQTLEIPIGTVHSRLRLGRALFQRAVASERLRRAPVPPAVTESSS